jgi:hypothetical protein
MTPTEIEDQARLQYNAVSDNYFSQGLIFNWIYFAQMELATKALCIQSTFTTATVASQAAYTFPTNSLALKRVEYQGVALKKTSFREDDSISLSNSTTLVTGSPRYYYQWGSSIFLRPAPASANTLGFYAYNKPTAVTANTTLEVDEKYHPYVVNYVLAQMYAKDQNSDMAGYYRNLWRDDVQEVVKFQAKEKRGDAMPVVQSEENLETTILGAV